MITEEKYGLKIFEETDDADLVKYSEDLAAAIVEALDNNKGGTGASGKNGLGIYKSSTSTYTNTTSISISSITVPSGRTLQVGDLIIGNSTYSYLYRVTAVNSSTVTVTYLNSLRGATGAQGSSGSNGTNGTNGTDGAEGLGIFRSSTSTTSTGSTTITISTITVPSGRSLKIGDLIITANSNLYRVTAVTSSSVTVVYLQSMKGEDGAAASVPIVNNLTSTSTTSALSAAQGKVLNEKIGAVENNLKTTPTTSALNKEILKQRTITLCEKFLSDCVSLNTYLMWGGVAYQEIVVETDTNRDKGIAIMVLQDKLNNLFDTLNEICSTCPTYSTSLTNKISNLSSCTQTARTNLSKVFDNTEVSTLVANEMSRLLQKSEANTFLPNPTNNDSLYYYVNDILTILKSYDIVLL